MNNRILKFRVWDKSANTLHYPSFSRFCEWVAGEYWHDNDFIP